MNSKSILPDCLPDRLSIELLVQPCGFVLTQEDRGVNLIRSCCLTGWISPVRLG